MAESPLTDNDMFTSYSNPNYTLNDADALNSNLPNYSAQYIDNVDPLYATVDNSYTNGSSQNQPLLNSEQSNQRLQRYDSLETPCSETDSLMSPNTDGRVVRIEHSAESDEDGYYSEVKPKGFLGYYASLEKSAKASSEERSEDESVPNTPASTVSSTQTGSTQSFEDKLKCINSPDSNDSGIQADVPHHIHGPINDDIYSVPNKPKAKQKAQQEVQNRAAKEEEKDETDATKEELPPGWQKHEDEDGAYYWHIKSGTIQREPPGPQSPTSSFREPVERSLSNTSHTSQTSAASSSSSGAQLGSPGASNDSLRAFEGHAFNYATESLKTLTSNQNSQADQQKKGEYPIRFDVRSLGWVCIAEEDLTPERSSKAVNKCIMDLSLGRNDINDVVGRWGDGKDLYLDLDNENLSLVDPQDMSVLNIQPIHSIRVWGVGRDNGRERDFAYVARDRKSRRHMCHVFRCDTPARQIANALRDICKKIMMERNLQQSMQTSSSSMQRMAISRPNNLPNLVKDGEQNGQKINFQDLYKNTSFPTPMEEPKKIIRAHYLGTAAVAKPTGVEVLNGAMEKVYARVPPEKWVFANVAVAPSTITITEHGNPDNILAEGRVRFLSFMGIAQKNAKMCAFIMHTAQDQFVAYVFHAEPSAGALCKTIEAACKLRYQKCMDAHALQMQRQNQENPSQAAGQSNKQATTPSISQQLKAGVQNVFGMLKKKGEALKS